MSNMTQQEIDELFYRMQSGLADSEEYLGTRCHHEYEFYAGFTEAYHYCTKCDYKVFVTKKER